jgi:hypothetical protein
MTATVLTVEELERVRRRLLDVPCDDAVRLLATVDYLRAALGQIRHTTGPRVGVNARNLADHALYPTKGLTRWKRAR